MHMYVGKIKKLDETAAKVNIQLTKINKLKMKRLIVSKEDIKNKLHSSVILTQLNGKGGGMSSCSSFHFHVFSLKIFSWLI